MKFLKDIDIVKYLSKVVESNTKYLKKSFRVDIRKFELAAGYCDENKKYFLWLSSEYGTFCSSLYNAYTTDHIQQISWTFNENKEGNIAYAVRVKYVDGRKIVGDLIELNYRETCKHIRSNSVDAEKCVIFYKDGTERTITLPDKEKVLKEAKLKERVQYYLSSKGMNMISNIVEKKYLKDFKEGENKNMKVKLNLNYINSIDQTLILQETATYDIHSITIKADKNSYNDVLNKIVGDIEKQYIVRPMKQDLLTFPNNEWEIQICQSDNLEIILNPYMTMKARIKVCRKLFEFLKAYPNDDLKASVCCKILISGDKKSQKSSTRAWEKMMKEIATSSL